jgi:hypothetical protein
MRLLLKMFRKLFLILPLMTMFLVFQVMSLNGSAESKTVQTNKSVDLDKKATKISPEQLPSPYNHLLTQPLMTTAIEKHYARTAVVKAVSAKRDQSTNTYQRSIIMFVDSNKARNNVSIAQTKNEALIVEFAFITMNFNELPQNIIDGVLHSNIPFGKLLTQYHLPVLTKDRTYFTVKCSKRFVSVLHCHLNDVLYGRTNTIIRADNKKWLAHVIEILPQISKAK